MFCINVKIITNMFHLKSDRLTAICKKLTGMYKNSNNNSNTVHKIFYIIFLKKLSRL